MIGEADLKTDEREGVIVAHVSGEVDLSNAAKLGQRLRSAIPNDVPGVVVDLTETAYLDSSGVSLVFELAERLNSRQQHVRVVVPEDAPLRRVLRVVHLESVVPILPTIDQAVEEIRKAA